MTTFHSGNIINYIKVNLIKYRNPHELKQVIQRRDSCTIPLLKKGNFPCLKPPKTHRTNVTTTNTKKKQRQQPDDINKSAKIPSVSSSLLIDSVAWYSKKLESHPLTTKCLSSGFIAGSGDLTCQYIVAQQRRQQRHRKQNHQMATNVDANGRNQHSDALTNDDEDNKFKPDLHRTGRFILLGGVLIGPTVHHWYGALMRYIPGSSFGAVLKRTFFDQAIFAPLFQPTFLASLLLLERNDGDNSPVQRSSKMGMPGDKREGEEDITSVIIRTVPDIIVSNWMLWIPAMMINFKYVPGKWQVLYSNGVGFVWNVYLSWKTQE